jgi:hypothetical protein
VADIEITCTSCSKSFSVSEYAKTAGMKCPHCAASLADEAPPTPPPSADKETPSLRLAGKAEMDSIFEEPVHPDDDPKRKGKKRKGKRTPLSVFRMNEDGMLDMNERHERKKTAADKRQSVMKSTLFSWLLFIVLGALLFFMRYGLDGTPHARFEGLLPHSWMAIALLHVLITISAATNDIMQGILCALIPGYSLLYIFWQSDDFYLRAATAAILIGFGQAGGLQIYAWGATQVDAISAWIASGGGEIRPN